MRGEHDPRVAHVLRRFGLGASVAELDYYGERGLDGAIEHLLAEEEVDEGFDLALESLADERGALTVRTVQGWWILRLLTTRHPLRERLTLFWHDHFATSAAKVEAPWPMYAHLRTLRDGAKGSFLELLVAVSRDPAMIYWLDNQENVRQSPNENFARELLELFTLGIGHYTERDVREVARAFTGWSYGDGPLGRVRRRPNRASRFVFRPQDHDPGPKEILRQRGAFGGEDVLRLLAEHPGTALHIARKMWEAFAYPDPEPELVERLARRFRESDLRIEALVRAILKSPEFYSPRARRALVKSPVDVCIVMLRQLGAGRLLYERVARAEGPERRRALAPALLVGRCMRDMGMDLLFPPDVDGWKGGAAWVTSATMVERMEWARILFGRPARGRPALGLSASALLDLGPDPESLVEALSETFDADLPAPKRELLVQAARGTSSSLEEASARDEAALRVTQLLLASPEFQFA